MSDPFPVNCIKVLETSLGQHFDDFRIKTRPLRPQDPNKTISIYSGGWRPTSKPRGESFIGQRENADSTYSIRIQLLVKMTQEEAARDAFSRECAALKAILYRDPTFEVGLGNLQFDLLGSRERFQRFKVLNQDFLNNEVNGQFVHLALTVCELDTEVVKL